MHVMLVAPVDGPDYEMDMATGEMEPVEDIEPAAELAAKMDIMMELDNHDEEIFMAINVQDAMNDTPQEEIVAMLTGEGQPAKATITTDAAPTPSKPRKPRKSKNTNTNTQSKGKTMKNHEILAAFISANPGVTRATVFSDPGLQGSLRSPAQVTAIAAGDKQEVKRWNSCINRFIRKIRRDGTDIRVNGMGKAATYTIGQASGQLELPFDDAAEARNATIIDNEPAAVVEEAPVPPKQDAMRLVEEPNQSLDFESLLATLDEEEATVTSDDQVAFKAAQEMLK